MSVEQLKQLEEHTTTCGNVHLTNKTKSFKERTMVDLSRLQDYLLLGMIG